MSNLYHMNYAWRLNWLHCPYEYQKSQRQYVPWKLFSESPSLMYILFTVISRLRSLRRSIRIFCCIMYQETLDILTRGLSPECSRGFFFFFAFIAQCLLCIIKVKNGINTDIQNFKQREKKNSSLPCVINNEPLYFQSTFSDIVLVLNIPQCDIA